MSWIIKFGSVFDFNFFLRSSSAKLFIKEKKLKMA